MKLRLAIGLGGLHLSLLSVLVLPTVSTPAAAQGQNTAAVKKPSGGVACPSGWRTVDGSTSMCEPHESKAPLIYGKKDKETCAAGYHEVYRLWCSTRRP